MPLRINYLDRPSTDKDSIDALAERLNRTLNIKRLVEYRTAGQGYRSVLNSSCGLCLSLVEVLTGAVEKTGLTPVVSMLIDVSTAMAGIRMSILVLENDGIYEPYVTGFNWHIPTTDFKHGGDVERDRPEQIKTLLEFFGVNTEGLHFLPYVTDNYDTAAISKARYST